jgi:ABC-type transport system involved in cytochrome c biogenesis permease subunit
MATDLLPADLEESPPHERLRRGGQPAASRSTLESIIRPVASLKLTVALFALAVILVFSGTLAQARHDIWWVVDHYFRTPIAWIDWNTFFPPAWFADYPKLLNLPGSFPFPGGFLIGAMMAINLLAAHGLRFKIQTAGKRLWGGLVVIAVGCLLTWLVIVAGPDRDGTQATAPLAWVTLWKLILLSLAGSCVGIAFALFRLDPSQKLERGVLLGVGSGLLVLLGFLLFGIDISQLDPSAMRILWQLIKAEGAAMVLLAGCALVFRKRAGIVLLHAGIGLIMANELVVHFLHKEQQMNIWEGETVSYAADIRILELVIVDPNSSKTHDDVVAVPEALLKNTLENSKPLEISDRPFSVRMIRFYENALIPALEIGKEDRLPADAEEQENQANAGVGVKMPVMAIRPITGADAGQKVNKPAAYVEVLDRKTSKPIGTYLLSVILPAQKIESEGRNYEIALRFEREYKPYAMRLEDVRADMYLGTGIPRNYSSALQLTDAERGTDRRVAVRMNEPLRYGGETFYQSGYHQDPATGREATTLQVVSNFGWMIPYVACMIVVTGMAWQFLLVMSRFLGRRDREVQAETNSGGGWSAVAFPVGIVAACMALILYWSLPTSTPSNKFDFEAVGKLPVIAVGRVQPLDTLARNTLRMVSGREVFVDSDDQTQPAMLWLLDVIARPDVAREHRVFRIDNPDVRTMFELERRKGYRYSPNELASHAEEFREQIKAEKDDEGKYTIVEKKLQELQTRGDIYQRVADAFHIAPTQASEIVEPLPTIFARLLEEKTKHKLDGFPRDDDLQANAKDASRRAFIWLELADFYNNFMLTAKTPLIVPAVPADKDKPAKNGESEEWRPYASAFLVGARDAITGGPRNPYLEGWKKIVQAYAAQDVAEFNKAVKDYAATLERDPPPQLSEAHPNFEAWFNRAELFFLAQWWYFVAFCLVGLSWLTGWKPLNRAAFWLVAVLLIVHTFALISRMTISGRPPVTNLYSSALFIGWAGVLFGLVFESVYRRLGFGIAIAAISGFSTLVIAEKLALVVDGTTKGETIGVMQAVLDTQFWLATHVTCITLGYATTYIAGLLGLIYVVAGVFTAGLSKDDGKILARMTYGSLCFALLFSFFGTVLGGLWADDSWGRFWGWDPKENGALIIVLWNALILHARWEGLVKDRGLALLAIGGNIVTSWSWFGVNQLGVGLHSYGFTEGVLVALGVFCLSQIVMIGVGLLPLKYWMSNRRTVATIA